MTVSSLTRIGVSKKVSFGIFRLILPGRRFHKLIWSFELPKEISFWERYFQTGGLEWKAGFRERMDKNLPLQEDLRQLIDHIEYPDIKILDVGSGPQTFLGKKLKGRNLVIDAIDPLADTYNLIMKKYNIVPLVKPRRIDSEQILKFYSSGYFDLVVARNSLDHAYSPIESISNMIQIVKTGSYVYIITRPNEAINQNYSGLHQWNFFIKEGSFFIGNRAREYNISEKYKDYMEVSWQEDLADGWLRIKLRKLYDSSYKTFSPAN